MFDRNNSPHGGATFKVDGDLNIKKDYYPWLSEAFMGGYRKKISLTNDAYMYLKYQALQAQSIYFEPVLHTDFMVSSVQSREKKKGNHTAFTYPDGQVVADGSTKPSFRKLQALRLKAESQRPS